MRSHTQTPPFAYTGIAVPVFGEGGVFVEDRHCTLPKVPAGYFENTVRPALSLEQRNFYGRIPYCIKKTTSLV